MTAGTAQQPVTLRALSGTLQSLGMKISRSRRAGLLLVYLLSGWVLLPLLAYLAGQRLIGPYEGTWGLGSFLGSLYTDAGRGGMLALMLLFTPVLLVAIWKLRAIASTRLSQRPGESVPQPQ